MPNPLTKPTVSRNGESSKPRRKHPATASQPGDDDENLETYIRVFVENGLKLQEELMINHEAIAAAQREYRDEFQRKRQTGR